MTDIDSPPPYSESNGLSAVANGNTASAAVATTAAASAAPASSDSAHAQPSTLAVADVSPTPTAGLRSTSAGGSSAAVAVVEQGEEVKSEDAKTGQVAQEEDGMDEQFELDAHELSLIYRVELPTTATSSSLQRTIFVELPCYRQVLAPQSPAAQPSEMMHGVHRALPAVPGSESTVKPKLPATTTVPVVPCIVVQVSRGYPAEAPSLKMTEPFYALLMQHCRVKTADTYLLRGLQRNADGSLRWPLPCKQGTTNVESSILIDAVNAVNLNVEHFLQLAMHYKIYNDPPRAPAVLFRDFAFPPHVDAHYARYPVPRNGSSAPSASAVLASSVASTSALPRVRALYDVPAVDESELLLNVGDVVEVIHEREDGWMIGMLNGISGLLPRSHVEYISEAKTDVIAAGNK